MRTAIVTGAGGDIGRAIAAALLEDGYAVLVADIAGPSAEAAAAELGPDAKPCQCDVTDPASVARLAEAAVAMGEVAVLVNNAGGVTSPSLQSTSVEQWRRDLALNLEGAFNCFRAVEAQLKATKGSVVNIASVNGLGVFGHPGYSAAKAGLLQLTRMIAVEYGQYGIRCNAVAPGTVMTQAWKDRVAANPAVFEEARRHYPLGRVAGTVDIANAVRFLAGPMAQAITGVCLPVDCGLTAGQAALAATFSQSPDYGT